MNPYWLNDDYIEAHGFVLRPRSYVEKNIYVYDIPPDHPSKASLFSCTFRKQSFSIPNVGFHNSDGPAIIHSDGLIEYCVNGRLHRYEGPADIYRNTTSYWIRGNSIEEKDYLTWLDETGIDLNNLTDEDKFLIDLKWNKASE